MAGFCLSDKEPTYKNAVAAVDGNICRCTGYKSIERALDKLTILLADKRPESATAFVTEKGILPAYFNDIEDKLKLLAVEPNGKAQLNTAKHFVGGGTDLYVQQHDAMVYADIDFVTTRCRQSLCCLSAKKSLTSSRLFSRLFSLIRNFPTFRPASPTRRNIP